MGPQCPSCGAIYEWTCGELEELVTAPKIYFCQQCRSMFILTPEEVEEIQQRYRPALEAQNAQDDDPYLEADAEPDDDEQQQPEPREVQAPPAHGGPLALRDVVVLVSGPRSGDRGVVVVLDGTDAMVRLEDTNAVVRVPLTDLERAGP